MSSAPSTGGGHASTPPSKQSSRIPGFITIMLMALAVLAIFGFCSMGGGGGEKETTTAPIAQSQPAVVPEVHKGQVMYMKPFTFSQCIIQNLHRGWYSYVFLGDIEVRSEDGKVLAVLSASKEVNLGWMPSDASYYFCPSPSDGSARKIHIYNNWEASARSQSQP